MLWLGVVVGDDASAMQRACDKGRQRLLEQGLMSVSPGNRADLVRRREALDAIVETDEWEDAPPTAPLSPPRQRPGSADSSSGPRAALDVSARGRASFKRAPRALTLPRGAAERSRTPLDECERVVDRLEL